MRALFFVLGLLMIPASALAQSKTVTPPQAKDHVGKTVTVEGVVSEVHHAASGKMTFVDIGGRYPDNPFAAVIFEDDADKFPGVDALAGKTVDVTGLVKLYRGKPEIILNDPGQIKEK